MKSFLRLAVAVCIALLANLACAATRSSEASWANNLYHFAQRIFR